MTLSLQNGGITNDHINASAGISWGKINKTGATANDIGAASKLISIIAGEGLIGGGDLSANRSFKVDVGTTAKKIVQLDDSGRLPAVDGSQLTNVSLSTLTRGNYLTGNNFNGSAATTWSFDATSTNSASKVVARDASGNFAAGTITATLSGTATNATKTTITNDTTTDEVHHLTFVSGTSGNLQQKVSSDKLTFYPSSGWVGIGTPWPGEKLEIKGGALRLSDQVGLGTGNEGGEIQFSASPANSSWVAFFIDSYNHLGTELLRFRSDTDTHILNITRTGRVGIGTTDPAVKLQVGNSGDGTLARANSWSTFSDERLKKNFQPIPDALEKILSLNGYYYQWKSGEDQSRQVGVKAQEIEKVFPEVVSEGTDGIKSVSYSNLIAPVIEAIKQLYEKILAIEEELRAGERIPASVVKQNQQLQNEVNVSKAKVPALEAENAALKAYLCQKDPAAPFCKNND